MTKLDKNLFIRADAGTKIGTGHVMRCFALAESLKRKFNDVFFVSNQIAGNLSDFLEKKGFKAYCIRGYTHIEGNKLRYSEKKRILESDAEQCIEIIKSHPDKKSWLIIDHYGIDEIWEKKFCPYVEKIIVIDDLANRRHDCDLLVEQNLYRNMNSRYEKLIPPKCVLLLGPKYALLRSEFKKNRKKLKRKNTLRRLLISFGGSDLTNETSKVLHAVKFLKPKCKIDVVAGNANKNKNSIKRLCDNIPSASFYCQIDNIAELMANADLAIGGGGSMTWERCCMGLPAIVSILSENQRELTEEVARIGCVINLGWANSLTPLDYVKAIKSLNNETLRKMSRQCLELVDGEGSCRVANEICLI